AGHGEPAAGVVVIDPADYLAGQPVEHVATSAKGIGEDELLAHCNDVEGGGDGVGLPDERAVPGVQAPPAPGAGAVAGLVVAAEIEAAITRGKGAFGGDEVFGRQPDDVAGLRVKAGGQAVVVRRQAAASSLARRIAEERGIEQLAVQQAEAAVVTASAVF